MSHPHPFGIFICTHCGKRFTRVAAYDAHRVKGEDGSYRCLDDEEMIAAGMRVSGDQWFVWTERKRYDGQSAC